MCVFIQPGRIRLDFRELVSVRTGQVTGKQQVQRPGVGKWHRWGQQASRCDRGSVVDVARMEGCITCHAAPFIHFILHFLHV